MQDLNVDPDDPMGVAWKELGQKSVVPLGRSRSSASDSNYSQEQQDLHHRRKISSRSYAPGHDFRKTVGQGHPRHIMRVDVQPAHCSKTFKHLAKTEHSLQNLDRSGSDEAFAVCVIGLCGLSALKMTGRGFPQQKANRCALRYTVHRLRKTINAYTAMQSGSGM